MRPHSIIGLVALSLCSIDCSAQTTAVATADYVALGSSFAAGPDVGRPDPSGPAPCRRSLDNYARKLAARRGLTLEDRTCSGAKTEDIVSHRQFGLPPQIEAVGPATRLVTVTIGGNDVSYLGDLSAASCRNQGDTNCTISTFETLGARFSALRDSLSSMLAEVKRRAPKAIIVLVDYVTIAPSSGICGDRAPLTEQDMSWARSRAERLRHVTADAASDTGAILVKASELSMGHDVCAAEPWVYGWRDPGPTGRPLAAYHPRIEAMEAIAADIDRQLPKTLSASK